MITIATHSADETQALAKQIGKVLRGGELLEFVADVGGGKTTFVKGLAKGLDIDEVIQSPTFTISRIYKARNNLELHHFDFYRLTEAGIMAAELSESLMQPNAIVAIEWGEIVHQILPSNHITLKITSPNDNTRGLVFDAPAQYDYVAAVLNNFKEYQKIA